MSDDVDFYSQFVDDEWGDAQADGSGYADGDEISTARLALLTDNGTMCCECGAQFTAAHGCVTACTYCWKRLTAEERAAVNRASHPEVAKEAHRKEAKARKARKHGNS